VESADRESRRLDILSVKKEANVMQLISRANRFQYAPDVVVCDHAEVMARVMRTHNHAIIYAVTATCTVVY